MSSAVMAEGRGRLEIIDALRFVMALIVTVGHMGPFPVFENVKAGDGAPYWFMVLNTLLAFGPSAVMVFFIISGFCIHHPYTRHRDDTFSVGRFYARRYLRIFPPLIAIVCLFQLCLPETPIFGNDSILWRSALWSILCEEIYYALYPLVQHIRWRYGWVWVFGPVMAASLAACVHQWLTGLHLGPIEMSVLLFPIWLAGCVLAEWSLASSGGSVSTARIWLWRSAALITMWVAGAAHVKTSVSLYQTALPSAVVFYFWMRAEIVRAREREPNGQLVTAGRASYSLYLVHPLVIALVGPYSAGWFADRGGWILGGVAIAALTLVFFWLVEAPSHRLARRISMFPQPAKVRRSVE